MTKLLLFSIVPKTLYTSEVFTSGVFVV